LFRNQKVGFEFLSEHAQLVTWLRDEEYTQMSALGSGDSGRAGFSECAQVEGEIVYRG
jgi:hypothetical protein